MQSTKEMYIQYKDILNARGITFDEFNQLNYFKQILLTKKCQKDVLNQLGRKNDIPIMIGGGDESTIIAVKKGDKIWLPDGYIIAGESVEENKEWFEKNFNKQFSNNPVTKVKKLVKKIKRSKWN